MMAKRKRIRSLYSSISYHSAIEDLRHYLNDVSSLIDNEVLTRDTGRMEYDSEDDEAEYALALDRYQHSFPILLSKSFIILIVAVFEQQLAELRSDLTRITKDSGRQVNPREGFIWGFRRYYSKVIGSSFNFNSDLWTDIEALVSLRNAIIHNQGLLSGPRLKAVTLLYKRYPTLHLFKEEAVPTIPFCNQMLQLIDSVLEQLHDLASAKFGESVAPA